LGKPSTLLIEKRKGVEKAKTGESEREQAEKKVEKLDT